MIFFISYHGCLKCVQFHNWFRIHLIQAEIKKISVQPYCVIFLLSSFFLLGSFYFSFAFPLLVWFLSLIIGGRKTLPFGPPLSHSRMQWLFKDEIFGLHRIKCFSHKQKSHFFVNLNKIERVLFYTIWCCIECFDLSRSTHVC